MDQLPNHRRLHDMRRSSEVARRMRSRWIQLCSSMSETTASSCPMSGTVTAPRLQLLHWCSRTVVAALLGDFNKRAPTSRVPAGLKAQHIT